MNSLQFGFRGREYPMAKPAGVFRIMLLGDSMVFGHGVPPDHTLSAHMERLLNQRRNEAFYHVISCSRPGYSLMDTSILYSQTAHQFNPDLVVIILSNNDAEVVGTEHTDQYFNHCRKIWQEDSHSFPFFIKAFHSLKNELADTPCLIAYYGLSNDTIADQAGLILKNLCRRHEIPFVNLQNFLTWIPFHRAVASKEDGHPSGHAHRVAATELCRKLIAEDFLPAADHPCPTDGPDLTVKGVSKEWAAEELRAWCLARQDGKDKKEAHIVLDSQWPRIAERTYRERQIRIMETWWQVIQDDRAFDWRYYKEHFINIRKGLSILKKNIQSDQENFLDSYAFFLDPISRSSSSLTKVMDTLTQVEALDLSRPHFLDNWLSQARWAGNELISLQRELAEVPNTLSEMLKQAKQRLNFRFNQASNSFSFGMKLLNWQEYMAGFKNMPLLLTDKPLIEIRILVKASNKSYLSVLFKGKGEIPSFISDGLNIQGGDTPQYALFKYPLSDLFSFEAKLTGSDLKYYKTEYRVNRSKWRQLNTTISPGHHTDITIQSPLRPAFC